MTREQDVTGVPEPLAGCCHAAGFYRFEQMLEVRLADIHRIEESDGFPQAWR